MKNHVRIYLINNVRIHVIRNVTIHLVSYTTKDKDTRLPAAVETTTTTSNYQRSCVNAL